MNNDKDSKNLLSSPSKIASGILIVSLLALVVGLYNAGANYSKNQSVKQEQGSEKSLVSVLAANAIKKDHLLRIDIIGPILMEATGQGGFLESESNALIALRAMESAEKDDSIKGVLLRINSPGGTVGMSQELHRAVQRLSAKKPVVAHFGDVAASGGYYTACAADKIVSNPGALTGSIGVIISTMNFRGLMNDKLGVRATTIKSGKFKDLLSPYRDTTAEELALVQSMIDTSYDQFLGAVLEGRTRFVEDEAQKKILSDKIRSIADGRILVGSHAKTMGLVDEVGDLKAAQGFLDQMAKERFGLKGKKELPVEKYQDSFDVLDVLGFSSAQFKPSSSVGWDSVIPLSMKYPNQPLWVME